MEDNVIDPKLKEAIISSLMTRSRDVMIDELGISVWGEEKYLEKQKEVAKKVYDEFVEEQTRKED